MAQSYNSNRLVVPGAQNAIDQMKYEIANEFGVFSLIFLTGSTSIFFSNISAIFWSIMLQSTFLSI